MSRRIFVLCLLVLLLALGATTALAAPPKSIHIEVAEVIGTSGEPFTATGAAVDDGLICAVGTVDDISIEVTGPPSGDFRILKVLKRFYCDDSSGTFDVKMTVHLDLTTNATTANWKIVDGTGAYTALKGNGKLIGTPIVPGTSILDVYDGKIH
jgi:hypothetical protein